MRHRKPRLTELNLTPMIDIVFLLITIAFYTKPTES